MPLNPAFDRTRFLSALEKEKQWDVVVVGGGATGLGIAVDSATRGYKTLLLEGSDFAKGTSSRSTKLVHGGVRYLAQGDIGLVYEALGERGLLLKNAPHLVKRQSFVIPCYTIFSKLKFFIGLKLYDWLSGRASFGSSKWLKREEVTAHIPGLNTNGLVGGIEYFDGQFDDARLAINLAQTAAENGAIVLNYVRVTGLLKENERISGVNAIDIESGTAYSLQAKVVINATGVFVDEIMRLDVPDKSPLVRPSQGVHLVLDASFLPGDKALMIPETADGRVLFAIPWHNKVLVGTTDTPLQKILQEPLALQEEVDFILTTLSHYLTKAPTKKDIRSVFAGLRPLAAPQKSSEATKEISRSHKIIVSTSGLVTITGGKWTTYRKMAEDTINKAIETGALPTSKCVTKNLHIHGYVNNLSTSDETCVYGADAVAIQELIKQTPSLNRKLVSQAFYSDAQVVWAVRMEMARTVEDVLARRLRLLFLDAKAAIDAASHVAALMANELGKNKEWEAQQAAVFTSVARGYFVNEALSNDSERTTEVANLML